MLQAIIAWKDFLAVPRCLVTLSFVKRIENPNSMREDLLVNICIGLEISSYVTVGAENAPAPADNRSPVP